MGHRLYDPAAGRFLSRDPARDGGNWYAYCEGDPVNRAVPEGRLWKEMSGGLFAAGATAFLVGAKAPVSMPILVGAIFVGGWTVVGGAIRAHLDGRDPRPDGGDPDGAFVGGGLGVTEPIAQAVPWFATVEGVITGDGLEPGSDIVDWTDPTELPARAPRVELAIIQGPSHIEDVFRDPLGR